MPAQAAWGIPSLWALYVAALFLLQIGDVETNPGTEFVQCQSGSANFSLSLLSTTSARSLLDCAARCRQQSQCDVIHLCADVNLYQCQISEAVVNVTSSMHGNSPCSCFEKLCMHGGVEEAGGSCLCDGGYIGSRCERLAADCAELTQVNASTRRAVNLIYPSSSSSRPFRIHCGNSIEHVMMWRFSSQSQDFNRTWVEYAEGFGDLDVYQGTFWRGLRYWHYITSLKKTMLTMGILANSIDRRQTFNDFRVGGEETNFTMTYKWTSGNLSDASSLVSGSQFSTIDRDHDASADTHCAQLHGGGWWFSDCGGSNPTGPLLSSPGGLRLGIPAEAFWEGNVGNKAITVIWMSLVSDP